VRVPRVTVALLVSLIEHNVVSLVNSSAINAELAQGANDHLSMLVSREFVAWACDAPIEVALVMEDGATPRPAAHQIHSPNARWFGFGVVRAVTRCVKNAQIDLRPRVLVAANDYARPVHVKEQDGAIWRRLSQYVVLDGEVQIRVVACRDIALQLVLRVRKSVRKRGKVAEAAKISAGGKRAWEEPFPSVQKSQAPGWCHLREIGVGVGDMELEA
jgi:hypothetical protein